MKGGICVLDAEVHSSGAEVVVPLREEVEQAVASSEVVGSDEVTAASQLATSVMGQAVQSVMRDALTTTTPSLSTIPSIPPLPPVPTPSSQLSNASRM